MPPFASSENDHETHLPARESSWSILRRKNSCPDVKEFLSAPKLSLPRVYSDSMLCIHTSANSFLSPSMLSTDSSLSSSSSPPFVSPDSISSDSSNHSKLLLELSPDSSSLVFTPVPVSPSLSSFSNLSLLSNYSSQPVSNCTDIHGVKLSPHLCSRSASLPLKKPSTSIAERRGSLSKSLKLPLMNDNTKVIDKPSTIPSSREHGVLANSNFSCVQDSDSIEYLFESTANVKNGGTNSIQQCEPTSCPDIADSVGCNEPSVLRNCVEPSVDSLSGEDLKSASSKGDYESGSSQCSKIQSLVYRWPSLEKIEAFGANHLGSEAAFAIFSPSIHMHARNILYVWIGSSFKLDALQVRLDSDRRPDLIGAVDWNKIGCDLLAQFNLPHNTVTKIVKENEEPQEFLALLSSL